MRASLVPAAACGHTHRAHTLLNKVYTPRLGTGSFRVNSKHTSCCQRAAASHRLRCLMWETQFGEGREERKGGRHRNTSPFSLRTIYLDLSESRSLSSVAPLRLIFNDSVQLLFFFKKKCQFFSLNNHSAHPRWPPGTPPPPMPCWTGVPPTSPVIGPLLPLP